MAYELTINKSMFYTDGHRVVAVYFDHMDTRSQPLCFVYANSSRLHMVMSKPTYVSTASMDAMIEECHRINSNRSIENYIEHVRNGVVMVIFQKATMTSVKIRIQTNAADPTIIAKNIFYLFRVVTVYLIGLPLQGALAIVTMSFIIA